jgi:hypothetical protein
VIRAVARAEHPKRTDRPQARDADRRAVPASRWADHVAQLHRSERIAQAAAEMPGGVAPAHYTVRKLVAPAPSPRVLEPRRAPAQLSLFSKLV